VAICESPVFIDRHGWTRFVSMQNHYNLMVREEEREMLPLCAAEGVGVIPWSPLARGGLRAIGTRQRALETDEIGKKLYNATAEADRLVAEKVAENCAPGGVPRAQVALAWLLQQAGSHGADYWPTKPHHLDDAVGGIVDPIEQRRDWDARRPYVPHPIQCESAEDARSGCGAAR